MPAKLTKGGTNNLRIGCGAASAVIASRQKRAAEQFWNNTLQPSAGGQLFVVE